LIQKLVSDDIPTKVVIFLKRSKAYLQEFYEFISILCSDNNFY